MPILTVAGAAAGFLIPSATAGGNQSVVQNLMNQHWNWAAESLVENYTGYNIANGSWNLLNARGMFAAIIGAVGSKVMARTGANAGLAKIPMIGKYVKF
jgi:hypothetical protein